jgi:hypothetical protein
MWLWFSASLRQDSDANGCLQKGKSLFCYMRLLLLRESGQLWGVEGESVLPQHDALSRKFSEGMHQIWV